MFKLHIFTVFILWNFSIKNSCYFYVKKLNMKKYIRVEIFVSSLIIASINYWSTKGIIDFLYFHLPILFPYHRHHLSVMLFLSSHTRILRTVYSICPKWQKTRSCFTLSIKQTPMVILSNFHFKHIMASE